MTLAAAVVDWSQWQMRDFKIIDQDTVDIQLIGDSDYLEGYTLDIYFKDQYIALPYTC